jgi:hypothetical protein
MVRRALGFSLVNSGQRPYAIAVKTKTRKSQRYPLANGHWLTIIEFVGKIR